MIRGIVAVATGLALATFGLLGCNRESGPTAPSTESDSGDQSSSSAIALPETSDSDLVTPPGPPIKDSAPDSRPLFPRMVAVPAGDFTMGDGGSYCGVDERIVTLTHPFFLGRYEVTNDEYIAALQWAYDHGYVSATANSALDNLDGSAVELVDLGAGEIAFSGGVFSLRDAGSGASNGNHPVKYVSWYGAAAYCDWLSMMSGRTRAYDHSTWECNGGDPYGASGYRLPTDAEWEYAAQYDDERVYPWGDESADCSRANHYDGGYCVGWTSPVGSYADGMSDLGLYDMAGNVWEWCNDWYTCSLGTSPETDPPGPSSGAYRVIRGGSWNYFDGGLRCAARGGSYPTSAYYDLGFRIARSQ